MTLANQGADTFNSEGFHKANEVPSANFYYPVISMDGVSAAGTTIGTATNIPAQAVTVSTCAASAGIVFDPGVLTPGIPLYVRNNGANALSVYFGAAVALDSGSAGAAGSCAAGAGHVYFVTSTTQVRTFV